MSHLLYSAAMCSLGVRKSFYGFLFHIQDFVKEQYD